MIIIKTPQPDTEERLVVVPADACNEVREDDPRTKLGAKVGLTIFACHARDATPEDLERAGYAPLADAEAAPREARDAENERELRARALGTIENTWLIVRPALTGAELMADLPAAVGIIRSRAEKAEGLLVQRETELREDAKKVEAYIKSLHSTELETRRVLGAVLGEPTAAAAARLHHDWVDTRERAEKAERERDEARESLGKARDDESNAREASSVYIAERDEARAEFARLTAPAGEPRIVPGSADHLEAWSAIAAFVESGGGTSSSVATQKAVVRIEGAFRSFVALGVAHERARLAAAGVTVATAEDAARFEVQPAQDRATDEELCALFRGVRSDPGEPDASRSVNNAVIAVAARVRGERCLERQIRKLSQDGYATIIGAVNGGTGCADVTIRSPNNFHAHARTDIGASDLHATLARLLGEVSRG